ncbi:hypothetical protein E4U42_001583 [Claviceps africana]|uniref:Uncharacterized protein n=1 Tax=Claviceps africana TaxID=83212 RepID=A0A8K0J9N6_9HYPO|nr:hypothetical protein E4U42_001583 [Claviceps africana]
MPWSVGHATGPSSLQDQHGLRRQPQRRRRRAREAVALGGLVLAGMCVFVLYLVAFHHITFSKLADEPLTWSPPIPTSPAIAADTARNRDGVILLRPEQHVYRPSTTVRFDWTITAGTRSPDGVAKLIYLINGQFPGPLIEARSGDQVEVNVYNGVEQWGHPGVSIHWHGLTMKDANEMDGVVGLTQCAIRYKKSFTYRFRIPDDEAGTFWYHAHSEVQRADGLYGGIVVHKPARPTVEVDSTLHHYEKEQLLLVGDWYHRSGNEVLGWFVDPDHYGLEPAPESLLLNGKGSYNCSMAAKAHPIDCRIVEPPRLRLMSSGPVRLRIINTGVSAAFSIKVSDASIKPIAVDGGNWLHEDTPRARTVGLLHPGERVDVILDRTESRSRGAASTRTSEMTIELDRENMPLVNFALKRIQSFPIEWDGGETSQSSSRGSLEQPVKDMFNLADALGQTQFTDARLSRGPFQRAVLYSTMKIRAAKHNQPVGSINHTSWMSPELDAMPLLSLAREKWAKAIPQPTEAHNFDVPWLQVSGPDTWAELTLNNFDDKGHPFHLLPKHGYEFYVVSRQQSSGTYRGYNPFDHSSTSQARPLNVKNPLLKDTVHIPAMGYVVLRFPLDNEGLWLLHCHVLWHQAVGMGIAIQVGDISEDVRQRSEASCPAVER